MTSYAMPLDDGLIIDKQNPEMEEDALRKRLMDRLGGFRNFGGDAGREFGMRPTSFPTGRAGGGGSEFLNFPGLRNLPGQTGGVNELMNNQSVSEMDLGGILDRFFTPGFERLGENITGEGGLEQRLSQGLEGPTNLNNPFLAELMNRAGMAGEDEGPNIPDISVGVGNVGRQGSNRFLDITEQLLTDPSQVQSLSAASREVGRSVTEDLFRTGGAVDQSTQQALRASVGSGFGPASGGFDRARQNILSRASGQTASAIGRAFPQIFSTAVGGASRTGLGIRGQDTEAAIASARNRTALEQAQAEIAGNLEGLSDRLAAQQFQTLGAVGSDIAGLTLKDRLGRLGLLGEELRSQRGLRNDIRQSLFGGRATEFQQGMAQEGLDLNKKALEVAMQRGECGVGDAISSGLSGALAGAGAGSALPGPGNIIGAGVGLIGGLFGGGC